MAMISENQGSVGQERLEAKADVLVSAALNFHNDFEREVWTRNPKAAHATSDGVIITPSFHNAEDHIVPVLSALDAVVARYRGDEAYRKKDPFGIMKGIKEWNKSMHPPSPALVDFDDVAFALQVALAGHDLGNLTETGKMEDGKLLFADTYLREGAEERSVHITDSLIAIFLHPVIPDKGRLLRVTMLSRHFIEQTMFDPKVSVSNKAFWSAVQVLDQIGPYYFSHRTNEQHVSGLLNEWYVRAETAPNLGEWLGFATTRLEELVSDGTAREGILEVFDPTGGRREVLKKTPVGFGDLHRKVDFPKDIPALWTADRSRQAP